MWIREREQSHCSMQSCKNLATPSPANHHYQFSPSCSRIFNHSQPLALRDYNPLFLQNSFQHLPEGEREQTRTTSLSPNPDIQDVKTISFPCSNNAKNDFLWQRKRAEQGSPPSTLLLTRALFYPIRGSFPARLWQPWRCSCSWAAMPVQASLWHTHTKMCSSPQGFHRFTIGEGQ